MGSFDGRQMKAEAAAALKNAAYSPKKLVLIHSGVTLAVTLALVTLSYLLGLVVGGTGGLGGLGTRSILETVQMLLQFGNMLLQPFWSIGFVMVVLSIARSQRADAGTLLTGFHRFGPVLRLNLLRGMLYFALLMVAAQVGQILFMMTPAAKSIYGQLEQMLQQGTSNPAEVLDQELLMQLVLKSLPFMGVITAVLLIPVSYRLRMAEFILMDHPEMGALFALGASNRLMKKNCFRMFKLDLQFWYYYALELAATLVFYGDYILKLMGVEIGMSPDAAMFVFAVAGMVCQLAVYVWKKDLVYTTYARVYDSLLTPPPVQPVWQPAEPDIPSQS